MDGMFGFAWFRFISFGWVYVETRDYGMGSFGNKSVSIVRVGTRESMENVQY